MASKILLAFESSCDETSASILVDGVIKSNVVYTQTVHEKYGGVVPEVASRAHLQNIVPVMQKALDDAGMTLDDVNGIAFTQSPGLIGSLMVGAVFAKTIAQTRNLPIIAVDHIEAHAIAACIDHPDIQFPYLCLVVSGGHTQFMVCQDYTRYEIIGHTVDDAVGEAFDKIAKLLELPYPGGPQIEINAREGNPKAFEFPISEIEGLNFSFSGIKTAVLYFLQKQLKINPNFIQENKADICASIQYCLIETLMRKLKKAIKQTGIKTIAISGGVSANKALRQAFVQTGEKLHCKTIIPDFQYCTDNAGMIAFAGYHKWLENITVDLSVSASAV